MVCHHRISPASRFSDRPAPHYGQSKPSLSKDFSHRQSDFSRRSQNASVAGRLTIVFQTNFLNKDIFCLKWVRDDDGQTKVCLRYPNSLYFAPSTDNSNDLQAGKMTSQPTFPLSRKTIDNIPQQQVQI
jgi:hypothetical protein